MINPTLRWERVGDKFYRKYEGYNLQWAVEVANSNLAMAPGAGVLAVWDKSEHIQSTGGRKSHISFYTGAGKLIYSVPWDQGSIVAAFLSKSEELTVVARSGVIRKYSDLRGSFSQIRLDGPALEAQSHDDGIVVRLSDYFAFVSTGSEVRIRKLSFPTGDITNWTILPRIDRIAQRLSLLYIHGSGTQVSLADFDGQSLMLSTPPSSEDRYSSLTVSPDSLSIAAATANKRLIVYSSDFRRKVYTNGKPIAGHDLHWVGSSAVCYFADNSEDDELMILDLENGAASTLYFDGAVALISEIDGVRILNDHTHDFLTPVPGIVADLFRLGSTAPSSILLNAIEQLEQESPKANENLTIIGEKNMPGAVTRCYTAAKYEMDARWQKILLRAAAFGKASLDLFDSSDYLASLDQMRMANTLRQPDIGIFISVDQMLNIGYDCLIQRLEFRREYATAIGFAASLRYPTEPIFVNWALGHLQESVEKTDEEIAEELSAKLDSLSGVAYATIARKALDEGRPGLALELVNREPLAKEKVILLMDMKEHARALDEAVTSGDLDLVYYVLMILHHSLPLPQFYRSFNDNPVATSCYETIILSSSTDADNNSKMLHDFLYQMDLRAADAELELTEALATKATERKLRRLQTARKRFTELKSYALESQSLADYENLLSVQKKLEQEYEKPFVGTSVSGTILALLSISQVTRAQSVRSQFKISDSEFWWLRIRVLVSRRDWDGLWDFAQASKSPIGYRPFFEQSLQAGNMHAATAYIDLCTDLTFSERVTMFLECKAPERALELARKSKDDSLIRITESKISEMH